jgi:hypothetical protein
VADGLGLAGGRDAELVATVASNAGTASALGPEVLRGTPDSGRSAGAATVAGSRGCAASRCSVRGRCRELAERGVDDVLGAAFVVGQQVDVGPEGEAGIGVTEALADGLDGLTAVEQDAGLVVPKCVAPVIAGGGNAVGAQRGFPDFGVEVVPVDRLALAGREDQSDGDR